MTAYGELTIEQRIILAMRRDSDREWNLLELCLATNLPNTIYFREALWRLIDYGKVDFTAKRKLKLLSTESGAPEEG